MSGPIKTIVYSCTFADYDYTFGPLARTPNASFLRFGDTSPNRWRIWNHLAVPDEKMKISQTLTNRWFKLFPHDVLTPCDVAIYVDGNILVRADLTPLIEEFYASGADIALFPHPSGRTVAEEIDFAFGSRIPLKDQPIAKTQRDRYNQLDILDTPITENTILFYRMDSPKVAQIGELWWDELQSYTKRDQISLPYVIHSVRPKIHFWDFHFHDPSDENIYFQRTGHRRGTWFQQLKQKSFFLKDYAPQYRLVFAALKAGGVITKLPHKMLNRFKRTN